MILRSLVPLLNILRDFGQVLIYDDRRDLVMRSHKGFHHYQYGSIMVGAADMALRLIQMGDRVLAQEQQLNQIMNAQLEEDERNMRVGLLKQYLDNVKRRTKDPNDVIYAGDLDRVRVHDRVNNQNENMYTEPIYARRSLRTIPALPSKTLEPPRAPDL